MQPEDLADQPSPRLGNELILALDQPKAGERRSRERPLPGVEKYSRTLSTSR